jgi:integrase
VALLASGRAATVPDRKVDLMPSTPRIALVVETWSRTPDRPYWAASWRDEGRPVKRRVGAAWLVPVGHPEAKAGARCYGKAGAWTERRGRVPGNYLDERQAHAAAAALAAEVQARRERERRQSGHDRRSFRVLAREWQQWAARTGRHKPSWARGVESILAEPGVPYRRGTGATAGRVMAVLGDLRADKVTAADVEQVLAMYSESGASPRTVNKIRAVVGAIFNFGCDPRRGWGLARNPAAETDARRQHHAGGLRSFSVEEVEAIARAATEGAWREDPGWRRNGDTLDELEAENREFGELVRVAAYTGLRQGELVALRWRHVRFADRVVVVERALSDQVELPPKSGKDRTVPLADQALGALHRLSRRDNFVGSEDYVFCSAVGDRLDPSALRRRYARARDAAGAQRLPFHCLRHTAASLMVRRLDPVSVQAILGHGSVKTTERYLHARRASALADDVTRAFEDAAVVDTERELAALVRRLPAEQLAALLEYVRGGAGANGSAGVAHARSDHRRGRGIGR